jgi:hypothetical protein
VQPSPADDAPVDASTRAQVIDSVLQMVAEHYVFRDVAAKLQAAVRAHQKRGDYDRVTSSTAFAELLTAHMFAIAHDGHLSVRYSRAPVPPDVPWGSAPAPEAAAAQQALVRFTNGGFDRVERLDGNVGYVKFSRFGPPWSAGDTVTYAMSFVAETDALIIDLRDNTGGYAPMVTLVESYLFDGWPVHTADIYHRAEGQADQAWTASFVPGRRFGKEKPVYVLTSTETVSAAEGFAYELQALKRATIVGEKTAGAANPGRIFRVGEHFSAQVAEWQVVNAVTRTNWEGTGVKPDVAVRADLALPTARLLALDACAGKASDPEQRDEIRDAIADARAEIERLKRTPGR